MPALGSVRPALAAPAQFAFIAALAACAAKQPAATTTASATQGAEPAPAPRAFVSPYSYEWFVRAELHAAAGRYAEAVAAYEAALTSADDDPYVLARLAEALDRAGDREAAEHTLERALALDPRSEAAWLARGRIAERRDRLDEAIHAYERAEAGAPYAPDAPLALAALLRRTGHPERADAVLARFAARTGRSPSTTRAQPADGDPRRALEAALEDRDAAAVEALLATTAPDALGGPLAVAAAYLAVDRPAQALETLEQNARPEDPDPHRRALLRAQALLALERPAEAAALAAAVPEASAQHAAARRVLIQALEAAGLEALAREVEAR